MYSNQAQKIRKVGTEGEGGWGVQGRIDVERSGEERRGETRNHLAGEVMTQHIHLSGRCLLLLLYRGHTLTGSASSAPASHCDNATVSVAARTKIKNAADCLS